MKILHKVMERLHNIDKGALLLRIALGVVFINAGWIKLVNIDMVLGFFNHIGFPAWMAYFVAYAEFIGGIALILGLFTRYFAIVLAIIMAVAIKTLWGQGFSLATGGYEYTFTLCFVCLAIMTIGAGKYSLDRLFKFRS